MAALVLLALSLAAPDLVIQRPHRAALFAAAFRPDGKVVATGAYSIKLWDVGTGRMLVSLPLGRVNGLAWTPDGRYLVAGLVNARVRVWDAATMKLVFADEVPGGGYCDVAVSPDGKLLAWGGDGFLRVTTLDGRPAQEWTGADRDRFWSVAFTPDGRHVVGAGDAVYTWRLADGALVSIVKGRTHRIRAVNGELVTLRDQVLARGETMLSTAATAFAVHGARVAIGDEDGVRVDGKRLAAPGSFLAFAPGGETLLCGTELWNVPAGTKVRTLTGSTAQVVGVAGTVAAIRRGEHVDVWDLASDRPVARAPAGSPIVLSPGATHLWCGGRIVDLATGATVAAPHQGRGAAAIANGGRLLAWRVSADRVVLSDGRALPGKPSNDIFGLAFSPDGTQLLQGGKGNYRAILDIATGEHLIKATQGPGWVMSLALSNDGATLLCGGPYASVVVRDAKTLAAIRTMEGHRGSVRSVAFAAGERRIVTVGGDGTARVWNAATGAHLLTLHALDDGEWIAIAPDGRYEASKDAGRWAAWRDGLVARPLASRAPTKSLIQGILAR